MAGRDLIIDVEHAFGNCRKYLHHIETARSPGGPSAPAFEAWRERLNAADREIVGTSTHVFVGTQDADGALDAQYKGGMPGWLLVEDDHTILYPDYPGNGYFMSLGNLQEDPRLCMIVPGGLLLQGEASLDDAATGRFPGAQSAVRFSVTRVARVQNVAPWETRFVAPSSTFSQMRS